MSGVRLETVGPELRAAVLLLAPRSDELRWVGRVRDMLPVAETEPTRIPVAIVTTGGAPVGYLTLDWGDRSRRYAAADALGIHGFLIDRHHRRRGYASAALLALPMFVREQVPGWSALALTVNVRNHPAIGAYHAAGFVETGERFLGGDAGPQHVMTRPL